MSTPAKRAAQARAIKAYYAKTAAPVRRAPVRRAATRVSGYGAYKVDRAPSYYKKYRKYKTAEKEQSLGSKIGSFIGHGAQQLLKAITGFGDYNIDKNSIMEGGMSPPEIVNSVQKNGFIIRHREYIGDIPASTTFTNHIYDINPGLSGTFPYVAQIAKAFELYRLRGLVFEFKSTSSDAVLSTSASSALGIVAMATQYNSLNPGFTNLIQMENHEFANSSKPSCDFYHPVECKKSLMPATELYVRTGAVPDGGDIRLFDIGQFNIATSGMQNATGTIGQLWATYEVEFSVPRYDAPTGILSDHIFNSSCSASSPLGTVHSFSGGNSIGLGITPTTLTFPNSIKDGNYLILMRYVTASASTWAQTIITVPPSTDAILMQVWADSTGPDVTDAGNSGPTSTSVTFHMAYLVQVLKPGLVLSWPGGTGTVPSSNMDLFVTQFDADIVTLDDDENTQRKWEGKLAEAREELRQIRDEKSFPDKKEECPCVKCKV